MDLIGIDIGGTNIKAGLFDSETGQFLERATLPTNDGIMVDGVPAWAEAVKTLIAGFEGARGRSAIPVGISAPGLAARNGQTIQWMRGRMAGLEGFTWLLFWAGKCKCSTMRMLPCWERSGKGPQRDHAMW